MGLSVHVGVTGASGLIGGSLVAALHDRGDTTTAFVRPSTRAVTGNVVRWDPDHGNIDEGDLQRAGGFDVVVHLAGVGIGDRRWTPSRKREILTSRVDSTSLLVQALRELNQGVALLASGSAVGWYGSRGDEILDEASPPGDGFLSDVCRRWEDATLPLHGEGTSVALLRTGIVVSSRGGAVKKQLPLFRLGLGGYLATGQQWMSPISLLDEVRALLWVIDHHITGPVNLCAPEPLTNAQFTQLFARQLRRPAFFRVPKVALRGVLGSEMADELVLASQRVVPRVLGESGFLFRHPDASSALNWALALENEIKSQ
jgi:uncharacterized protein (TIGR01777 family)